MRDAIKGASCFVRGFGLLSQPRIRRYVIAPFALSTVVFVALIWFSWSQFGDVVTWMVERVPDWLVWIEWLLWILFAVGAGAVVFFTFVLVVGLVAAPFNGPLSEAVEKHLTGDDLPSTPLAKTLIRLPGTLFDELKKVLYALLLAVPFLLLFLIPGLNLAAPALWLLCCAWVTGFSYADYPLSNHGLKLAQIRAKLARRRLLTLGFGGIAFFALMVPFLNLLAVPAAVCGATILWVEELNKDPL